MGGGSPGGAAAGGVCRRGAPRGSPVAHGCGRRWHGAALPISLIKHKLFWGGGTPLILKSPPPPQDKIRTGGLSPPLAVVSGQFFHQEEQQAARVVFRAVQEGLVPHVTPKSQLLGGGKRSGGVGFPKWGPQIDPYVFRAFFLGGGRGCLWREKWRRN